MVKKICAGVLAAALMTSVAFGQVIELCSGNSEINILTDTASSDTLLYSPLCINGRTFVEMTEAARIFGIEIKEAGGVVTATCEDKSVKLFVNENKAHTTEDIALDTAPLFIEGTLYIPIRPLLENLSWGVGYSASLNQVIVSNNPVIMEIGGNAVRTDEFDVYYNMQVASLKAQGATDEQIAQLDADMKSHINYTLQELNALYYAAVNSGFGYMLDSGNAKSNISSYLTDLRKNVDLVVLDTSLAIELEKSHIVDAYFRAVSAAVSSTDEEIDEAYKSKYITAKHILIPSVNLETGEALSDEEIKATEKLVLEISEKLKNGEDFDKLMKEYSKDTGLAHYPDGYTFTTGEMVAEFETAAFNLKENEVSKPIKTNYGYHIIKRLPLADLSDSLKQIILSGLNNTKLNEYIKDIVENSDIKIITDEEIK